MSDNMKDDFVLFLLYSLIIIVFIFEISILIYSYTNADEVNCNFLWCEFKTNFHSSHSIYVNSDCYYNGVKTNCSDMKYIDDYKKPLFD